MTRRGHRRLRVAIVVTICLLIQQITLAAYACTMTMAPIASVAMTENCAAMENQRNHPPTALCQKHCSPDPTSEIHQSLPSVPALALPPVTFGPVISRISTGESFAPDSSLSRSHPPPRLRYCRLLI